MTWNLQHYPTTVLNDRMWHFRGSKHTLTPTTYFQEVKTPIPGSMLRRQSAFKVASSFAASAANVWRSMLLELLTFFSLKKFSLTHRNSFYRRCNRHVWRRRCRYAWCTPRSSFCTRWRRSDRHCRTPVHTAWCSARLRICTPASFPTPADTPACRSPRLHMDLIDTRTWQQLRNPNHYAAESQCKRHHHHHHHHSLLFFIIHLYSPNMVEN